MSSGAFAGACAKNDSSLTPREGQSNTGRRSRREEDGEDGKDFRGAAVFERADEGSRVGRFEWKVRHCAPEGSEGLGII